MNIQTKLDSVRKLKDNVIETMSLNAEDPEVLKPGCSAINLFVLLGRIKQEESKLTDQLNECKLKLCCGCYHCKRPCSYFKDAKIIELWDGEHLNCWEAR